MKFDATITLGVLIHLGSLMAVIVGTFWVIRKEVVRLSSTVERMSEWMQDADRKLIAIEAHIEARATNILELNKRIDDHENRLRILEKE